MPLAGVHAPADLVRLLSPHPSWPDDPQDLTLAPAPAPYGPIPVDSMRHLLGRIGTEACLTHTEADIATRVLIECLGDGLTRIAPPPGDAARLPGEVGDPAVIPE